MTEIMKTTMFLTALLLLLFPLVTNKMKMKIPNIVKTSLIISLIPTAFMIKHQTQNMTATFNLANMKTTTYPMTFIINKYSMLFLPTAIFVTWAIMTFSTWYMKTEPMNKFQTYLLIFLTSMLILATSGNMIQLMVGWEGVGIMSFMLINWWSERSNANSAALQAIIYNRIGDIGLILAMVVLLSTFGTWDITSIMTMSTKNMLISAGLMMAAMGKSAQFFMHMWLPTAMEGPTPVSALLHSSTMVVAGVYLLAQLHPVMNTTAVTTCLYLGTLTTIYSALCALTQNDIKKIIAFSTSSQLGLMMIAIGIHKPGLAMFHMITHATFKSTLFLCSGSIIHNMKNEQDIRKTNCTKTTLPMTSTMMMVNGLSLAGTPFLSGFYSKDAIIETMMSSNTNAWALIATMLTTTMTASYTMRMMFYTTKKFFNSNPTTSQHEKLNKQTTPLMMLTIAAITTGTILSLNMLTTPQTLTKLMKTTPLLAIVAGTYMTMELVNKPTKTNKKHLKFLSHLAFYGLLHRTLPLMLLTFSEKFSTKTSDTIWFEYIAPVTIDTTASTMANVTSLQKGLLKNYFMLLLIFVLLSLTTLIM